MSPTRFVGAVHDNDDHLTVRGPGGEVRLDGSRPELEWVLALLDGTSDPDGHRDGTGGEVIGLYSALDRIGAVSGRGRAWSWFHALSGNHRPDVDADTDENTDGDGDASRGQVTGRPGGLGADPLATPWPGSATDDAAARRVSADLGTVDVAPYRSFVAAAHLAYDVYRPGRDGRRRPVASGGGLNPLRFLVIGADEDPSAPRRICAIDHAGATAVDVGRIGTDELTALFVPDPAVASAIRRGAALVLVAAEPDDTLAKYGDRGWRLVLMESGAAMHHMSLAAAERGIGVRPLAGFFDLAAQDALCDPLIPLLFLVVAAP